jgi:hypothetical protein
VLDQPVTGRIFFEEVVRENLDIGRPPGEPDIRRKINRRTPGQFRTGVITDGVVPSLHIDYKKSRIKQYHKLLEALRTETTINDTRDFGIGRRIENLAELRKVGFAANRRLLDVQRISHDCLIGEAAFQDMQKPAVVGDQVSSSPHCARLPQVGVIWSVGIAVDERPASAAMPSNQARADLYLFRYSVFHGTPPIFARPLAGNIQLASGSFGRKSKINRATELKGNQFANYARPITRPTWS